MRGFRGGAHESSGARDDSCASQADHALRTMVRRVGVSVATNTSAGERPDGIEPARRIDPQPRLVDVTLRGPQPCVGPKRSSDAPNPGNGTLVLRRARAPWARPASVRIVRACVQDASSVQYQGVTLRDLERGRRCLGTTGARGIPRVARHVTNRRPTGRGAARGETPSSRRSVSTRSGDPRCLRVRLLAPQSLRGPVPSAVRRTTE